MPTWGRGGAGNIVSDEQIKQLSERSTQDLEAARPKPSEDTTHPPQSAAPPQDYAHMGRGGAGNWYQPTALRESGTFSTTNPSATSPADNANENDSTAAPDASARPLISSPWVPEGQQLPVARAGRGGAGNFVWGDSAKREEEERRRKEVEEMEKERVAREVERDVEGGLERPGRAVLGGAKGERGGRGW